MMMMMSFNCLHYRLNYCRALQVPKLLWAAAAAVNECVIELN